MTMKEKIKVCLYKFFHIYRKQVKKQLYMSLDANIGRILDGVEKIVDDATVATIRKTIPIPSIADGIGVAFDKWTDVEFQLAENAIKEYLQKKLSEE